MGRSPALVGGYPVEWRDYIGSDPAILVGKPVIRGTRLSVEFLLGLFAEGWTEEAVLECYPQVSQEALRAMFAFAQECARDEQVFAVSDRAAG